MASAGQTDHFSRVGNATESGCAPAEVVDHRPYGLRQWLAEQMRGSISWLLSMLIHMAVVLILVWWSVPGGAPGPEGGVLLLEPDPEIVIPEGVFSVEPTVTSEVEVASLDSMPTDPQEMVAPLLVAPELTTEADVQVTPTETSLLHSTAELSHQLPAENGGGFDGRSGDMQRQLLLTRGGSDATEDAVARALAWIAAHQNDDGWWSFDHHQSPQGTSSPNPGKRETTTGATGMALLPFLGKGYTHLSDNPYRETVERGLYYLKGQQIITQNGGDLQDGSMYGHGLATIALCEAYAMTEDPSLRTAAQESLRFIEFAQHSKGGWRYTPGEPGDTSVFGWQLMGMKSGLLGGLRVSSTTIGMSEHFLDTVQAGDGAYYGYMGPGKGPTTTSVGLLCRMYLGWPREDPRLEQGMEFLAERGPSKSDMYFNYYATQVLAHHGGPRWDKWNEELSQHLVNTQSKKTYEAGSWYFQDQHAKVGGRLYCTCLATMILEVYYRHMPLYTEDSIDFRF